MDTDEGVGHCVDENEVKGESVGEKGESEKDVAALQRALLATAFSAECRTSDFTIQRRALSKVLRRAQVPRALMTRITYVEEIDSGCVLISRRCSCWR